MTRSPKTKLAEQGFTMIEMVVVMMMIVILAGIAAYTYIPMIGRLRLSSDVRKVDQALQQAKMRAVASGVPTGVIFYRREGAATANNPDEMYIFSDSVMDGHLTMVSGTNDPPCRGCKVNSIYNPAITDGKNPASQQFIATRCKSSDTFPNCKTGTYRTTHDDIVDGPIPLESGDYFTRILDSKNTGDTKFSISYGREFILFDQFGKVVFPASTTSVTVNSRRIYLQNHPNLKGKDMADRAAVQLIWASGVTQVVRMGPAHQNDWTKP